jgi:DNA-binding transcriptional LysR family regulator
MSMDVSTQQLRALRAVVELGSLTAAAERLGFTQSALSKQMAALESATGTALLRRGPRGAEPTAAGLRFARRAAVVLDELEAAEHELAGPEGALVERVALGAFPTAMVQLVPGAAARLRLDSPGLEVEFLSSSTPVQLRRLATGRLQLAVVAVDLVAGEHDLGAFTVEHLPAGPLLVAVPTGHRLARAGRVDVADLEGESWVVGRGQGGDPQFGAWPTLVGPRVVTELTDWPARLGFVAAGLGITCVPTLAADGLPPGVSTVQVDDPALRSRSLLLASAGPLTPGQRAVRQALMAEARRIADGPPAAAATPAPAPSPTP